jgi:DNA polymerase III alpha subunit
MHETKSNALDAADNKLTIKDEIRKLKVNIIPPDVNKSDITYKIIDDNTLMTGFDALKFMTKNSIPEILEKRPFGTFNEFLSKIDGRKVNCAALQALAASGSLECFGLPRKQMYLYSADYKKKLQLWLKKGLSINEFNYEWPNNIGEWTFPEKYAMEQYYLGEGLCCGIREAYSGFFNNYAIDFAKLAEKYPDEGECNEKVYLSPEIDGIVEGVVKSCFEFKIKKENSKLFGETMARVDIEDPFGNSACLTLFPSKLQDFKRRLKELSGNKIKLEPGIALYCSGQLNWYDGSLSIIFDDLKRCAGQPPMPKDLEKRSIKMKMPIVRKSKKGAVIDKEDLLEEIEDDCIENGFFEM